MLPLAPAVAPQIPTRAQDREVERYFKAIDALLIPKGLSFEVVTRHFYKPDYFGIPFDQLPCSLHAEAHTVGASCGVGGAGVTVGVGAAIGAILGLAGGPLAPATVPIGASLGAQMTVIPSIIFSGSYGYSVTDSILKKASKCVYDLRIITGDDKAKRVFSIFRQISAGDPDPLCSHFIKMAISTPCNHTFELWDIDQYVKTDHAQQFEIFRKENLSVTEDITSVIKRFKPESSACPVCRVEFFAEELRIDKSYYSNLHAQYKQKVAAMREAEAVALGQAVPQEVQQTYCTIS